MSHLVMARIKQLNGPLLAVAETHGRRLDDTAKARKVRDEPSLTWVPDGVEGDPLALADRLAGHVADAFVPKGRAKALHLLVKLPDSVPVATVEEARAALELVVQFAQDTYGGDAVFSARMDRDERSINNVDVFLAPKYLKKTKRAEKLAVSMTRHTKLLVEKHGIAIEADSARGSMVAQGQALQTELANWLTAKGYRAERGRAKEQRAPDWESPEVVGARKDREAAERDRAAIDRVVQEELGKALQKGKEATDAVLAAADTSRAIVVAGQDAARQARQRAAANIRRARARAKAAADRRVAERVKDREAELATAERQVARDRRDVDLRAATVKKGQEKNDDRAAALDARDRETRTLLDQARALVAELGPVLRVVRDVQERLKGAPEAVRRWLDPAGTVAEAVTKGSGLLDQARQLVRPKGPDASPATPPQPAVQGPSLAEQARALARGRGGR